MLHLKPRKFGTTTRMSFARIDDVLEMPNLIEVQTKSYEWFLKEGIDEVLREVSPIVDHSGTLSIDFVSYSLDSKPRYSVEECKDRDVTYDVPLRVSARLTIKETGEVKQSEIFMCSFPLMTEKGTFIINGTERVVVSQVVRSPGMYYAPKIDVKTGKHGFTGQVVPYRGAWLEYETDALDVMYVKIDKNRKLPVTVFVRALGEKTDEDIYRLFGDEEIITATIEKDDVAREAMENGTDLREEALKAIYKRLRPGEPPTVESAEMIINTNFFDPKR